MKHNPSDAWRYDANFALKVSPFLWLIILWSCHHALLLALGAVSKSGDVFALMADYAYSVPLLISNIPGVIVLAARINRTPHAGAKTRWLWHHGITLLVLGLSISTVVTVYVYQQKIADPENFVFWMVAVNLGFIAYLVLSRRARAIFADFPSPTQAVKDGKPAKNNNVTKI